MVKYSAMANREISQTSDSTPFQISHQVPCPLKERRQQRMMLDSSAHQFFWTVTIGQSPAIARLYTTRADAAAAAGRPLANGTDNCSSSMAGFHALEIIPRIPLSRVLQTYFFRMQHLSSAACHPCEIHDGAVRVVSSLLHKTQKIPVADVARTLLFAGIEQIEYSRTVALVVHDVMTELIWRSWDVKKKLEHELVRLTIGAFVNCWTSVSCLSSSFALSRILAHEDGTCYAQNDLHILAGHTGLETLSVALEDRRTQMLNISAFLGDLFALSFVPVTEMESMVHLLTGNLWSVTHCRALYLLLLHASSHIATPLGEQFLLQCRHVLIGQERRSTDTMFRSWLIVRSRSGSSRLSVTTSHRRVIYRKFAT